MGVPGPHPSVKLFCGLLGADVNLLRRGRQLLVRQFGPVELAAGPWPFEQTDYYAAQMGHPLKRAFLSFERRVRPDTLAAIKCQTNRLEAQLAADCLLPDVQRPLNIDPGYLDLGKVVLASTKDRAQRVYIGQRIFAEVTLYFARGAWQAWPWTYPDYRQSAYHEFFMRMRQRLKEQRRRDSQPARPRQEARG